MTSEESTPKGVEFPTRVGRVNRMEVMLVILVFILLAVMFGTLFVGSLMSVQNVDKRLMESFPELLTTPRP
jgi:hypothetical protein